MQKLIDAVKAHANDNYDKGGWDVIVECWTDGEIADWIRGAQTEKQAIDSFLPLVSVWADQQADARNSAF